MITKNAHILIAAGFMRSPSDDLRSPPKVEVIHETCKDKHKEMNKINKKITQTIAREL